MKITIDASRGSEDCLLTISDDDLRYSGTVELKRQRDDKKSLILKLNTIEEKIIKADRLQDDRFGYSWTELRVLS